MKRLVVTKMLFAFAALALVPVSKADDSHNQKLGDAMYLLVDQVGGLGEISKKNPAEIDDKGFNRVMARCRGAVIVLNMIKEKQGHIEDGKLVPGEMTPGKFLTVEGEELATMIAKFEGAMGGVRDSFVTIEAELSTQFKKSPSERDFRPLKLLLVKLDDGIKKAHQEFKPKP